MSAVRDDAVVLGRLDYSETSQIVVLLTRDHGKIRAIAKGVKRSTKKRFAVGIELLDIGHVVMGNRRRGSASLSILTEWKQTRSLAGLREKLFRIHAGQYIAEITANLLEDDDPHPDVFVTLVVALETLCEADEPLTPVVAYQHRLLVAVGSYPRFDACVRCGRADDLTHFSSHQGGMLCAGCEPAQPEKRAVSADTHRLFVAEPPFRSPDGLTGPFRLLNYHLSHLMGKEPRLAAKLLSIV